MVHSLTWNIVHSYIRTYAIVDTMKEEGAAEALEISAWNTGWTGPVSR